MKTYKCKICEKIFNSCQELGGHVLSKHKMENHNAIKLRAKNEELYYKEPKLCEYCKKIISYDAAIRQKSIYCSRSCSASVSNRKRYINREKKIFYEMNDLIKEKVCLNCKIIMKDKRGKKYCSSFCSTEYRKKIYLIKWIEEGKLPIRDGGKPNKAIREYILKEQGGKCAICFMNEIWNNKPILFIIDHINGNSSNSSKENLRLICPNCDSQTDTFKGKNKGNGRFSRVERYKKSLSY